MRAPILYVPIFAAFEADPFALAVADWADVQSFDGPGAGSRKDEVALAPESMAPSGAARLDALGWERCALVCDSHAQAAAVELALRDPRVAAIAVGHPAARYSLTGERPALNPAIYAAAEQLLRSDMRSFARALTQLTQGVLDDEQVERFMEEVPREAAIGRLEPLQDGRELLSRLAGEELEVLLGGHRDCMMWTAEGVEDAAAALPGATTVQCAAAPMADADFHAAVRELCARTFG
jgi:hypothetical protein